MACIFVIKNYRFLQITRVVSFYLIRTKQCRKVQHQVRVIAFFHADLIYVLAQQIKNNMQHLWQITNRILKIVVRNDVFVWKMVAQIEKLIRGNYTPNQINPVCFSDNIKKFKGTFLCFNQDFLIYVLYHKFLKKDTLVLFLNIQHSSRNKYTDFAPVIIIQILCSS